MIFLINFFSLIEVFQRFSMQKKPENFTESFGRNIFKYAGKFLRSVFVN